MLRLVGHMEEYQYKICFYCMQFLLQNKCMKCCSDGKSIFLLNSASLRHVNKGLNWFQEGEQKNEDQGV